MVDGRKVRSGRIGKYYQMNVLEILQLADNTLRKCLRDENVPIEKRADLAMRFIAKHTPDRVDIRGQVTNLQLDSALAERLVALMEKKKIESQVKSDAIIIEPTSYNVIEADTSADTEPKSLSHNELEHNKPSD